MADRKRVVGPEKSVLPLVESGPQQPFNPDRRKDGRSGDRIRPLFLKTGIIKQADGSAYIETGRLKVACGVYGPRQSARNKLPTQGTLNCDFKFSAFSSAKRRAYAKDNHERECSLIVYQALAPAVRLDLIPKSTVDVYIQILESDGNAACLAAAITCAAMALADAGIEMTDAVAASSAGYIGGNVVLDPDGDEETLQNGSLMVSYMPSLNEVTHMMQIGEVTTNLTVKGMEACVDACSQIRTVMQQALAASLADGNS
ncbi:hypothetical protein HK097_001493 [Rhizophlyctis rosea]|uniref:Uncharacterized protein n=1 Tax=Rhizophlyctis rosea TaxID=64517 RepID=A0AAD5SKH2_9FUNG|nr:hypothetical protein HK097_001493 [Rhizophlyctis rosea]